MPARLTGVLAALPEAGTPLPPAEPTLDAPGLGVRRSGFREPPEVSGSRPVRTSR
ncbi:hypothetical protein [Streptosporangium sp. H16]|uniref:hypothetical protein n=1 Tax=Streptosporangium sp. H16 TaxID=3444184 RepID=UPI003F79705B